MIILLKNLKYQVGRVVNWSKKRLNKSKIILWQFRTLGLLCNFIGFLILAYFVPAYYKFASRDIEVVYKITGEKLYVLVTPPAWFKMTMWFGTVSILIGYSIGIFAEFEKNKNKMWWKTVMKVIILILIILDILLLIFWNDIKVMIEDFFKLILVKYKLG